ncbi:MAG: glycosyltransferase [Candidatus Bathyarchaeia archaeon]
MRKKKILFVSAKGTGISADKMRIRYFRQALETSGYNFINFEMNLSGFRKFIFYLFKFPPKGLVDAAENSDLIMATSPPLINAILSYKVAKNLRKPLIVDVRDIWEEYAKTAHFLMYNAGVIPRLIREYYMALNYSSKIITVTEILKQYYERKLDVNKKDDIVLISNGTDTDLIKLNEEIKREIDAVCLVDLNQPYHNLEFLFNALKLEKKLTLMVIGGGKYLYELKKTVRRLGISDRVSFVGWVPYENLSAYLCRARIGVVGRPFLSNIGYLCAIPVKTYDYLAAGLPIVAYGPKNSALEEFIKKNDVGTYIDYPDPERLCSELVRLSAEHERYIERARALAMKFDRKELSKKLVEVVNSILN